MLGGAGSLFAVGLEQQAGRSDHSLSSGVYASYLTKERTYTDRTKQKMGTDRHCSLCIVGFLFLRSNQRKLWLTPKELFSLKIKGYLTNNFSIHLSNLK